MGNTEMTAYMAAGAFDEPRLRQEPVRELVQLARRAEGVSTYNGKLFGVPYYAGSRVITYRTDLFKKAGVKKPPTSLAQFQGELGKVGKMEKHVKGFAPLYVGGEDWYTRSELRLRLRRIDRREVARQVGRHARFEEVGRRADRVQGLLQRHSAEVDCAARRHQPVPVHRVLAGPHGRELRAGLVQLLHRQEVQEHDRPVRDAEPHEGQGDAGLPRRLRSRGAGAEQHEGAGGASGSPTSRARRTRRRSRRRATSRTPPTCSATSVNERAAAKELVRAAGRSTGSTSRTATSSGRCSPRSSPAGCRSRRPRSRRRTSRKPSTSPNRS